MQYVCINKTYTCTHAWLSFLIFLNERYVTEIFSSFFRVIFKFNLRQNISFKILHSFPFSFKGWKQISMDLTKTVDSTTQNTFYPREKRMFNVLKNQFPRTHLALPPSKLRSLLYPPLRHKCVSVWIWTLHQNKHNSLIMLDFTILIGSYKTTEKKQV